MGEKSHAKLQKAILLYLSAREKELGIWVIQEQRVQVSAKRFRIPDICVTLGEPNEEILHQPPFICIEVLSPEDRWPRTQQRIDDYLGMGVPYVWVLDPITKQAYSVTKEGTRESSDGFLRTQNPAIELPLSEIFA
jgi:Uma2 family endonuclease